MEPTDFPESNVVFHRPKDMTDEECCSLNLCRMQDPRGWPILVSAWRPSPEELGALIDGKPLYLTVVGNGHPPVILSTRYPFR